MKQADERDLFKFFKKYEDENRHVFAFSVADTQKSIHLTLHDGQVIKIIRWWQLAGSFT